MVTTTMKRSSRGPLYRIPREAGRKELLVEELQRDLDQMLPEIDSLPEAEKMLLSQCLDEIMTDGESITASTLFLEDFRTQPVTMEEFLTNDMYFGREVQHMRPAIRGMLIEIFDGSPATPVSEVILSGSIGWGKSYASAVALLYVLYRLTCMRDPHAYYGLAGGSKIYIAIYSVSREQAEDSAFAKIREWVDLVPYFREHCPRNKLIKSKIVLHSSPVEVITGSRELHTIGRDIFAFFLDEANFLDIGSNTGTEQQLAYRMYASARKRIESRFCKGKDAAGMILLASSKRTRASFLESHVKASRARIFSGATKLYQFAAWEVLKASDFQGPKFRVEVGNLLHPSRFLKDGELPRPGAQVVIVPIEYREAFELDLDSALREIAGIATESIIPLITDRASIMRCVDKNLAHPFTRETVTVSTQDDIDLGVYFMTDAMFRVSRSKYQVRLNPDALRIIAIDIAFTGDAYGMACGHLSGFKRVNRMREDGTYFVDIAPIIVIDFMLRVTPPGGEAEIDSSKMRAFVQNLRDLGLPILRVVMDGFQGLANAQIFTKMGFDAAIQSVDRTDEQYLVLKQAIAEGRLRYYEYPTFIREIGELERDLDAMKVDHPHVSPSTGRKGTKDISDAVCNCVFGLLQDKRLSVPVSSLVSGATLDDGLVMPAGTVPWSALAQERRR